MAPSPSLDDTDELFQKIQSYAASGGKPAGAVSMTVFGFKTSRPRVGDKPSDFGPEKRNAHWTPSYKAPNAGALNSTGEAPGDTTGQYWYWFASAFAARLNAALAAAKKDISLFKGAKSVDDIVAKCQTLSLLISERDAAHLQVLSQGSKPEEILQTIMGKGAKGGGYPAKEAKADKGGKKADKGAKKEEPPAAADPAEERKKQMKKVVKEGGKRGVEIEGAADMGGLGYFCTSVDEPQGDLEFLQMSMDAMNAESDPKEEERKGGSGRVGKMIFSAGTEQLAIVAYVPTDKKSELSATDWLDHICKTFGGKMMSKGDTNATAVVKTDDKKGIFPLKVKEPGIMEAISFLKKKGLFPNNDDDDDDYVFGDDDFPS